MILPHAVRPPLWRALVISVVAPCCVSASTVPRVSAASVQGDPFSIIALLRNSKKVLIGTTSSERIEKRKLAPDTYAEIRAIEFHNVHLLRPTSAQLGQFKLLMFAPMSEPIEPNRNTVVFLSDENSIGTRVIVGGRSGLFEIERSRDDKWCVTEPCDLATNLAGNRALWTETLWANFDKGKVEEELVATVGSRSIDFIDRAKHPWSGGPIPLALLKALINVGL